MATTRTAKRDSHQLNDAQARAFFDRQVQRVMGYGADEFLRRHAAGELPDTEDVLMLLTMAEIAAD